MRPARQRHIAGQFGNFCNIPSRWWSDYRIITKHRRPNKQQTGPEAAPLVGLVALGLYNGTPFFATEYPMSVREQFQKLEAHVASLIVGQEPLEKGLGFDHWRDA